ncbi:MAG TPA: hypothetical protein VGO83_13015, partial [Thermoleophilaceae bacterium]|nr:hypothetical protein [Thermoleophilaceae bacterium]
MLALQGTAEASVVSVTRTEGWDGEPVLDVSLSYTALVGETNRLRVEQASGGGLLFSDRGVERIFEAQDGCEQVTAQQVVCRPDPYE